MTARAPPGAPPTMERVPSNERLRELAKAAEACAEELQTDRDHFIKNGQASAAKHYAAVIQQQADTAAALRAVIAAREVLDDISHNHVKVARLRAILGKEG